MLASSSDDPLLSSLPVQNPFTNYRARAQIRNPLGDDAFGVEVAQRLARQPLPPEVRVIDFGICGIDLMYELLDGYDAVVLVDAVQRGEQPGTLYLMEPGPADGGNALPMNPMLNIHDFNPAQVLAAAQSMGSRLRRVLLVGCEPLAFDDDASPRGLSPAVAAAIDEAILMIEAVIVELIREQPIQSLTVQEHAVDDYSMFPLTKET